jgi:hypothetical protein
MVWLPYERAKQLANEATFVQSDPVWQEGSGMWQGRLHDTLDHSDPDRFARASALLDRGFDINARAEYKGAGGPMPKSGWVRKREQCTALYNAAVRGDLESVEFLLSRGADPRVRNLTGGHMMHTGPFKALETLCGLDAMRTSKNLRIVQLAEELYGEESEEDFVRRRDAFDSVVSTYGPRNWYKGYWKAKVTRVPSVLKTRRGKKLPSRTKQDRYQLRPRDPKLSYA